MTSEKVELEFVADSSSVDQSFDKVDRKIDDLGQSLTQAKSGVSDFFAVFAGSLGAGLVLGALDSVKDAFLGLPDIIQRGSGIDDITASFQDLSEKAGTAGDTLLNGLSTALGDTIPKLDLMQQANELLIGGLKPEEFETVAKAARSLGEATGVSAKEGMEQLSNSLLKGNDKALKSLGIIVDLQAEHEKFAASIGKERSELTELQIAEVNRTIVLDQLKKKTSELAEVTDDSGDVIDQMRAYIQDQVDEALKAVGTNEDLKNTLVSLRDTLKEIDFTALISGLTSIITLGAQAANAIISFTQNTSAIDQSIAKLGGQYKVLDDQLGKVVETLSESTKEAAEKAAQQYDDLVKVINETSVKPAVGAALKKDMDFVAEQIMATRKQFDGLSGQTLPKVVKATNEVTTATGKSAKADKDAEKAKKELEDATKKYADELKKQRDEIQKVVTSTDAYKKIIEQSSKGQITAAQAGDQIKGVYSDIATKLKDLNGLQDIYNKMLEMAGNGANVASEDLGKVATQIANITAELEAATKGSTSGSIFGDLFKTSDQGLANVQEDIGSALAQGLTNALESGDFRSALKSTSTAVGSSVGSAVGLSIGGPIGAAIGGSLGQALADKFATSVQDIGKSSKDSVKGILTIFAPLLSLKLLAVNAITGGLGDELISKAFGGDSAGTTARKSIDRYFADLFDANKLLVVIDGQLQQIRDLDLGGGLFGSSSSAAGEFFSGLSSESQGAFSVIAQGFSNLLGQGEEVSAGLAMAFANNLGGSLNNLQLLVEATGVSFEQLREGVVESFLDGEISIREAASALQGIERISEKGIPDALGAVDKAWENLKNSTNKGGRAMIDAIKDVGYEAKELGIRDLGGVMEKLKQTAGVSAEEVDRVFLALKASGIDSIEKLTDATNEQLIGALSSLDDGSFFQKQIDDAKALSEVLGGIPTKKDLTVNVKVNYQNADDQRFIQQVSSGSNLGQGVAIR